MPSSVEPAGLALDACGLRNLAASGLSPSVVAEAFAMPVLVVEQVAAEALWVDDVVGGEVVRVALDPSAPLFVSLSVVSLTSVEAESYVDLAHDLDDGEARRSPWPATVGSWSSPTTARRGGCAANSASAWPGSPRCSGGSSST